MELDLLSLTTILDRANGSQRGDEQKMAESKLKQWEVQPGYHYLLQTVYTDLSLPLQIRWLAVINFKNGIEKYWRSSRQNCISVGEKSQIKAKLFEMIDEPNKQLSIQNSQAISRICRFDFPNEWPQLFDQLEVLLQTSIKEDNNVKIHNLLIMLNQILKNLSMAKIGKTRPALQSKIPIIVPILIKLYSAYFNDWIESLDFAIMEIGYLSLKVLTRIIIDVQDSPIESHQIVEFLSLSIKHFEMLTINYDRYAPSEFLEKYIKRYSKIYNMLAKTNPTNLILLPSSKDILYTLLKLLQSKAEAIYNNQEDDGLWEFVMIKTLLIFKYLINFLFKKGAVLTLKSRSNKQQIEHSVQLLTNEFFTEGLIKSLTDLLINFYIKLSPKDLDSWVNEPEEWANDEVNQNYEFQVRQCAENFFQDLINNFKGLLVPYILNKIQNELANYNDASRQNILLKDSIFSIFQLSANSIFEVVDFNNLFENIFLPESLKNDLVENKVLKRRVCLLINEWIGLSNTINDINVGRIYSLLIDLQDSSNPINDKVVRLTSIQTLKALLTDWDFKREIIKPYISRFIDGLLRMIDDLELTESKLFLLNTIATLISKTNPLISIDELDELLQIIPKFWDLSNNANELILKNSLLRILKNLIISLNSNSNITWNISLPLVRVCCSPTSEYYSLLSEDGYELWLAILQFYPIDQSLPLQVGGPLIQDLIELFQDGLLNQTEILPLILQIFRSYTMLIPELVTHDSSRDFILNIFKILANYLPSMRDDSLDVLVSTFEIIILENYSNVDNFNKLLSLFMQSGLLPKMIEMILDDDQSALTVSKLLLIIARLAYLEPSNFAKIFELLFTEETERLKQTTKFLNIWYVKMENVGNPRNRKIHTLGLSSLLKTGSLVFFQDFKVLVALWISSLEESNEAEGDCPKYHENYLYEFQYNETDLTVIENGEYKRFFRTIETNDPVHSLNLKKFVADILELMKQMGDNLFNKVIGTVNDTNLLENLDYFLKLNPGN